MAAAVLLFNYIIHVPTSINWSRNKKLWQFSHDKFDWTNSAERDKEK